MERTGPITRLQSRLTEATQEKEEQVSAAEGLHVKPAYTAGCSHSSRNGGNSHRNTGKSTTTTRSSQGKSHSKQSVKTNSTKRRRLLEAQIRADEEMAKIITAEEELTRQKLLAEQEMVKRRLEHKKKMIKKKLALEELLQEETDSVQDSKEEIILNVPQYDEREKVCNWLDGMSLKEQEEKYQETNASGNDINQEIKKMLARQTVEKDLPIFSGDVKEWANFWNQYVTTTKLLSLTDEENMCRLRKCLKGNARRAVEGLLICNASPSKIVDILKNRFGRPEMIVRSLINDARNLQYVKSNDFASLSNLSDTVQTLVATLETLEMKNYLSCPQLLSEMLQKLPYSMQLNWGKKLATQQIDFSLTSFQEWIAGEAEGARYIQNYITTKTGQKENKYNTTLMVNKEQRQNYSRNEKTAGGKRNKFECLCCRKEHTLENCEDFKSLSPENKWQLVKAKNVCFSCMKSNHRIEKCVKKRKCGMNGCEKYHHPMLHNNKYEISPRTEEQVQASTSTQEERLVAHTTKFMSSRIYLKVAPVVIRSGNKEMTIYALFDEASTITLIDEDIARKFGLKGEITTLGLKWTDKNTRKEVITTKLSFKIFDCDKKEHELRNVYTMKDMDLPVQSVNAKKLKEQWRHLKDVSFDSYVNVSPKLLIGQDNWQLIASREIIEGPKNAPALSRTRLGWVLHGNIYNFRSNIENTVLHVQQVENREEDNRGIQLVHRFQSKAVIFASTRSTL